MAIFCALGFHIWMVVSAQSVERSGTKAIHGRVVSALFVSEKDSLPILFH
jgi:hypothetical protein